MKTLPPDLLSIPQAAERLGVSANTVRRLIQDGEFPEAIRVGRQWRVSKPRLDRRLHGEILPPAAGSRRSADGADPGPAAPVSPAAGGEL